MLRYYPIHIEKYLYMYDLTYEYGVIEKKLEGHIYWYAVEMARVDGKPKKIWQKYLGTVACGRVEGNTFFTCAEEIEMEN